jgi:hypothetical protein
MANSRILWNGNILDFPAQTSRFRPNRLANRHINTALSGKREVHVFRKFDSIEIRLNDHSDRLFHENLQAWWDYAMDGNAFAFSLDSAHEIDDALGATLTKEAELITNEDFEAWSSPSDADDWTEFTATGGSIARSHLVRYSGRNSALLKMGTSGRPYLQDGAISLTASTKYRARCIVKPFTVGTPTGKILFGMNNSTTGNWLQADGTWGASVTAGPFYNIGTGAVGTICTLRTLSDGWVEVTFDFTTEGSGNVVFARATLSDSGGDAVPTGDGSYWGLFSVKRKQVVTIANTDGVIVGSYYKLRSADGMTEERVRAATILTSTTLEIVDPPKSNFASSDIFRSVDFYPSMEIPERIRRSPHQERPTFLFDFNVTIEESF